MNSPGARIGLAAVLLLAVTSALVWDRGWKDSLRPPAAAPPPAAGMLRLSLGGGRPASPRPGLPPAGVRPPPGRPPRRPAPPSASRRPPRPARTWRVAEGDCLSDIARKVYGTSRRWPEIAAANGLRDPFLIRPGDVLRIP